MNGIKVTQQVTRKKKPGTGFLKGLMILLGVLFVLMGIFFSRGFMLSGFLLVGMYFIYDVFSQKEYEYTVEGVNFAIDVILGRRHRKRAHMLNLQELEVIAPNWHEKVAKYRIKGGSVRLKKYDYTSYDDAVPYYTMIIMENGKKIKILLDLDEEMINAVRRICPGKIYLE